MSQGEQTSEDIIKGQHQSTIVHFLSPFFMHATVGVDQLIARSGDISDSGW